MKTFFTILTLSASALICAQADLLGDFEAHASSLPGWNDEAKAALAAEGDEATKISAALRILYPDLGPAMESVSGNPAGLLEMTESPDPYLASESSFYLARELMKREEFEKARPFMKQINEKWADKSPRALQSLYYQGVVENELLMRADAIESLSEFIEASPKDSRLSESAQDLLGAMEGRGEGSIGDVADHMGFSERRLDKEDPGKNTQEVQEKIVKMLDTLIAEAEKKEEEQQKQQQPGGSSPSPGQGNKPGGGEGQNAGGNPNTTQAPKVVRRVRGSTKSAWDDLRQKDRNAEALSAIKSKYPPRYQQLIEQYYRDLNESANGGDESGDDAVNPDIN